MSELRADAEPPAAEPRGRSRGRPRGSTAGDARATILKAAADEFAERGYEASSLRAIARRAGVDPALVHHYFEDKRDLFAETIHAPFRPDRVVPGILAGPRDQVGESVARYVLTELASPAAQKRIALVLRTAIGHNPATRMLREFLVREVLHRIAEGVGGPDADLRAALAASQVVGLIMTRYVLKIEPIASAPVDELVARLGPVLQWHLVGYSPGEALKPAPELPRR
ncbi:TetR/AcrR family transcriptional regulator [Glaciibacter sp. 2TAF33]|uniref:TetR/AcrR family transcriptional regulator n=1 Tax=Glaciibacter sp. 2TAF33 TaxID=3233015 RepID=UPI003F8EBC34